MSDMQNNNNTLHIILYFVRIMALNTIIFFFVSSGFVIFCYGGYFTSKHCTGYGEDIYYEIVCTDPVQFPNDLPKLTEKLTIICSKNSDNNNGSVFSNISANDFNNYENLISITIQKCSIVDLPDRLFTNFPYLQSVILDGLPIRRLRNIFYQSNNLIDLSLINLFYLEHIDSKILNSQKIFSRIVINNSTVNIENLMTILKPVKSSLKELRIINNRQELISFPPHIFEEYRLGLLDLQNNVVQNWDFLNFTKSRKILLANTQFVRSNFNLSHSSFLHVYCEMLDLENIGISGIFPNVIYPVYDHMKILVLKSNRIESLNNNIDQIFPHLQLLDISFNRIKHLQAELGNLFFKTDYFKIEGNPLHCNCQLRWLSARYKAKIKDFPLCNFDYRKSNKAEKSKSVGSFYFSQLATDSLICLPPKAPKLSITKGGKPIQLLISGKNSSNNQSSIRKEYTLIMNSNQLVELSCESEGDPVPTLTWSDKVGSVLTRDPPSHVNVSSANRLTLDIGGPNISSIYLCTASNIEGISYALLNLVPKRTETSFKMPDAIFKRIISDDRIKDASSNNFAQSIQINSDFNLLSKIFYFIICIVSNKYFS